MKIEAVLDMGASPLVIPETLRAKLGLDIEETSAVTLTGGTHAGAVNVRWNDRYTLGNPIVFSGETQSDSVVKFLILPYSIDNYCGIIKMLSMRRLLLKRFIYFL
jgi:hypothetical protein